MQTKSTSKKRFFPVLIGRSRSDGELVHFFRDIPPLVLRYAEDEMPRLLDAMIESIPVSPMMVGLDHRFEWTLELSRINLFEEPSAF